MAPPLEEISAIVPTLDEEREIAPTLASLRHSSISEVLVVDGGSSDDTREIAKASGARVLEQPGRLFAQLERGVRETRGAVLLFHYADVRFPADGARAIHNALADPQVLGGAFALRLDSTKLAYRWIERGTRVRNRLGLGPFGDQSIFVRRSAFEAVGGFPRDAFLADHQLVSRLRRAGRFALLEEGVLASVRRWEKMGIVRAALAHWWQSSLYVLGKRRSGTAPGRAREDSLRSVR